MTSPFRGRRSTSGEGDQRERPPRTPYYYVAILAAGTLAALAVTRGFAVGWAFVLAGGAALAFVGLADQRSRHRSWSSWSLFIIEVGVGLVAVGGGARLVAGTAGSLADVVSFALLVVSPTAFLFLDAAGGPAAATGAACAAGLLALALIARQPVEEALAGVLIGACLVFLRLNPLNTKHRLGAGAALLLGYVLAVTDVRLRLAGGATTCVLAVVACLAVPAVGVGLVLVPRFVGKRPLWLPGDDQLADRLRRLGLGPRAVQLLGAGAALAAGAAATFSVHRNSPLPASAALAAVAVAGFWLGLVRVAEPHPAYPLRRAVVVVLVAALGVVGASAALAGLAVRPLRTARADLLQAKGDLRALQLPGATRSLDGAQTSLDRARHVLSTPLSAPARLIPGLRANFQVADALVSSGQDLVAAGREGVRVLGSLSVSNGHVELPLVGSTLNLTPFEQAAAPAAKLDADIRRAQTAVETSPSSLLLSPVTTARAQALVQLNDARKIAEEAVVATALIPDAFGGNGQRSWVIGAENNAELRGRGGYMGSLGEVTTTAGQVVLGKFTGNESLPAIPSPSTIPNPPPEYPAHYDELGAFGAWQNLTMSPSFASGGDVLLAMLHAGIGLKADGLVGVDPIALSYLLAVTGPVTVAGIPEPLTASNVVSWTLNRIYILYPNDADRRDVLSGVAQAVFQRIVSGGLNPQDLASAIGRALAGNHLSIYSTNPKLEDLITQVGIGGTIAPTHSDYLLVVGQNQAEGKLDYYTKRSITYRGAVQRDGSEQVTLTITDRNTAPASLPDEIAGARSDIGLAAGVNRTYLSALVPAAAVLEGFSLNGQATSDFNDQSELGKRIVGSYVEVPSGQSATMQLRYYLPSALSDGVYQLTLQNQAMANSDAVSIKVQFPAGYQVSSTSGLTASGQTLTWRGHLNASKTLSASASEDVVSRFLGRL